MAEKNLNWLADFPAITTDEWMAKITTDLKGADFEKKLVWRTDEGFTEASHNWWNRPLQP